ncbi:hypothetical protein EYZ11_005803 [Aspergillus tanneri]|uniref:aminodeoxychorismate synthase n=1 Tax=Aspergillus tanneri TaxID=1220188 RepID=A0A4S3JH79_9EURO|nr:hypothetical protein EYZ11_005803 [Aspergillus tanneri]
MAQPRILFIDAYDSFSNNIITLVEGSLGVPVTKLTIDSPLPSNFHESYAGIIVGPGPGSPYKPADVGCIQQVWSLPEDQMLPVLGICLGFQSLVVHFGGTVEQLPYPRHGIETDVQCCNDPLFRGIPKLRSVQYHSLHGVLGYPTDSESLWTPHKTCPELVPLAWDIDHAFSRGPPTPEDPRIALDRLNPTHILMSVKHQTKPFYGVQFHPESVCSSPEARQVVCNWWQAAKEWTSRHRSSRADVISDTASVSNAVFSKTMDLGNLSVTLIRDHLKPTDDELVVLDSEMAQNSPLGNYSIVGLVYPDTLRISYSAGHNHVSLQKGDESTTEALGDGDHRVFDFLKSFMEERKRFHGNEDSPFWGGLMGYISYEACLETLGIDTTPQPERPDLQFAFVERSVVIDHTARQLHVQSIMPDDHKWVDEAAAILDRLAHPDLFPEENGFEKHGPSCAASSTSSKDNSLDSPATSTSSLPTSADIAASLEGPRPKFTIPTEAAYSRKIRECKTEIQHGNSYELCLTDQTEIDISTPMPAWTRYLRLRRVNPAPFGAFIRLGPITVLSSSPERFLSWTRPNAEDEVTCQFRPIKGTVKKRQENPDGSTLFIDLATATNILASPKERAESLMIVDLIRHDLTGVKNSRDVRTTSLMQVEEYESVYQLVTVIEGILQPTYATNDPRYRPLEMGIDVLAASLPPGSMTGAPKKRSCETWRIGAGGAITDMSQEMAEWDEMHTKVDAVLRSFKLVNQVVG